MITGNLTVAEDITRALDGFDTIVSCVGRNVIHTQIQLAQLADKHADVRRFFPSEYGTDIEYGLSSATERPHQQKLKVRAAIRQLKHLEYTCIVTGPYANAEVGLYFGANPPEREMTGTFDVKHRRAVLLGTGNENVSFTTMRDMGRFVAAALKRLEETRNRVLVVNSFTATPREILAEYEQQTGGHPWSVSYTSLDDLKRLEEDAWSKEDPVGGLMTLKRIWTEGGTLYDHRDNGILGLENSVDSLEDAVRVGIEWQNKYM